MVHLLARQYELVALIGEGPTGEVWRATDRNTGETVAVKMLDPRLGSDEGTVDRFVRERQVLTAFLHPAYVRVRDVIAAGGVIALVTEYVNGWDLRRHLDAAGPLQPAAASAIALTVAEALAAAHDAGVVHCELKPSNVLLEEPTNVARLTDSRVGRLARGYQGPAGWYANPTYAAPEVIRGGPPVPATDVYALGLVLYEMLAGSAPYRGMDVDEVLAGHLRGEPSVPPTVPPHLKLLVEDCLQSEPAARPTAAEVAERLRYGSMPSARDIAWSQLVLPVQAVEPELFDGLGAPFANSSAWGSVSPSGSVSPPGSVSRSGSDSGSGESQPEQPGDGAVGETRRRTGRPGRAVAAGVALLLVAGIALAIRLLSPTFGSGPAGADAGVPTALRSPGPAGSVPVGPTVAPKPPASAAPETLDGAIAFVTHWFEALTYAVVSGDTVPLDTASSPQCRACADAARAIRDGYREGASLRGGGYAVRTVTADDFWTVERPALRVVFDRSPRSAVDADGHLRDVFDGGSFLTCQVLLERSDGRWRLLELLSPVSII